jgi:hypothetical protein
MPASPRTPIANALLMLKDPKSEAEAWRVMLLEARLAEGRIETERRRADADGFGSGVEAENMTDCESGGRAW